MCVNVFLDVFRAVAVPKLRSDEVVFEDEHGQFGFPLEIGQPGGMHVHEQLRGIEVPIHSHLHSYDGRGIQHRGKRLLPLVRKQAGAFVVCAVDASDGIHGDVQIVPVFVAFATRPIRGVFLAGERQASRMNGHGNDCVRMGVLQGIQHQVGVGAVATLVAREVLNQHTLDVGVKWLESRNVVGLIDGFNDSFHGVVNAVAGDKSEHEGQRHKQGVNTMFHETNFGKKWRQGHKKIRVTEATRILVH